MSASLTALGSASPFAAPTCLCLFPARVEPGYLLDPPLSSPSSQLDLVAMVEGPHRLAELGLHRQLRLECPFIALTILPAHSLFRLDRDDLFCFTKTQQAGIPTC